MSVRFSNRALRDLDDIYDWIARDDPRRAQSFTDELIDAAESIADFPLRFPKLALRSNSLLRSRTYGNYLIVYTTANNQPEIVAIVHGARDLDAVF